MVQTQTIMAKQAVPAAGDMVMVLPPVVLTQQVAAAHQDKALAELPEQLLQLVAVFPEEEAAERVCQEPLAIPVLSDTAEQAVLDQLTALQGLL
jgi:hypothetical protein